MARKGFLRQGRLVFVCVVMSVSLFGGCMSKRVNLVRTGAVSIRTDAPEHIQLSAAVYGDPDKITVYGTALASPGGPTPISGHVDVEVIGPDNALLDVQHVPYSRDNTLRRAIIRQATFRANIPVIPSRGVVIILRHHVGVHPEDLEKGT